MLAALVLAAVVAAVVTEEWAIEIIAGGALLGLPLALIHGDIGAALMAVVVLALVCWRWESVS